MSRIERCPTCKRRITRNNDQNRRLWALYHVMSEKIQPRGQTYSADTWHVWSKSKWLGCDDVKLPSGKVLSIPRSTATLDVAEFAEYMTQVEAWANEHGAWLEDEPFAA
jgi:NinB protein